MLDAGAGIVFSLIDLGVILSIHTPPQRPRRGTYSLPQTPTKS